MSVAHSGNLHLDQTPDVLLLPSQLNPFSKKIGDVLCVNPGKLTKGNSAGTFARLSVHPVVRHLRSGPAGGLHGSRKVAASSAVSPPAALEPEKAEEGGTSAAAATVSPQQLSQNFDSAVGDGGEGAGQKSLEEAAEGNADKQAAQERAGDMMQVDAAAAVSAVDDKVSPPSADADASSDTKLASDAMPAAAAGDSADLSVPLSADAKVQVAHRVCERTRVEIVRI
jgi:hypothetical protein